MRKHPLVQRVVTRREFSAALLGAMAFSRSFLAGETRLAAAPGGAGRPSMLLLGNDPFSGLNLLRARYASGRQPPEDVAGWALRWQITRKDEFAERAIAGLESTLARSNDKASRVWMNHVGMALAFDWLYGHRAFAAKLKDQIAETLLDNTVKLFALPDLAIPNLTSYHNYVSRYLAVVSFAMAAVGQEPSVAERCKGLRERGQEEFDNILETTQLVTPDGSYHESMDYFRITLAPLALLAELQRTTTGVDPARQFTVFSSLGATYLYKVLPDGTPSREGDNEYPVLDDKDTALLGYAVHRFKDPYAAWMLRDSGLVPAKWVLPVLEFLWNDPAVVPRDPAEARAKELPRQRYFSGVGHLVMRSGWEKDATWIEFDCGPYFSKHQHLSQNHFSIYHRGYLAIDSGADYTETESPHYLNYYRRTVAHNSVLVYDPAEKFFWSDSVCDAANDGGQRMDSARFWNTVRSLSDWNRTRGLWDLGSMRIADYQAGAYHYALGDATKAYSPKKVARFTRELLYVPGSNILFVFDRVRSTNPEFRKAWLLHGVNEPALEGHGKGGEHGATEYSNAKEFTFAHGDGELRVHCLLPEARSIVKRGGPGHEYWTPGDPRGGEWGSGQNWPLEPAEGGPLPEDPTERRMWKLFWGEDTTRIERSNRKNVVPGAWRVEVSPAEPATEDSFLHVLEIGDRGTTGKKQVATVKGHNLAGAAVDSGVVALFNDTDSALTDGEVTIPDVDCKELLLTGLVPASLFELTFAGPNIMAAGSTLPPGVEVKTVYLRSNEKGVLTMELRGLRGLRMRLLLV